MLSAPVFPKVESDVLTRDYGRFIIGAMEQGYGVTVGNALRRVLFSSLPGAAITSMRLTDVHHEFSDIPFVKEDVMQLMLNVKQIRLRMRGEGPMRMRLEVRGEGVVTAGDIIAPPEIDITNPDLYLLTTDSSKAKLDVEFQVEAGRGYSPAEQRGKLPIGELPVDAIYSPIKRVNFEVEAARVGQMTNYDRLILEVWTDGTMRPQDALRQSAMILVQHLQLISGVSLEEMLPEGAAESKGIPTELSGKPIEELELSVRVYNALKRTGISTIGDLLDMIEKNGGTLTNLRNFGDKSMLELKDKLRGRGLWPAEPENEAPLTIGDEEA
ncbi:MAG: DNA-directed RNA polymerase subunit alpha [Chloroflexi bacterium]|nr:DNA-directed RNA polymerase subunit alpha [Chloroflexota bacterium]MCL5275621.1 DNA-directed RNA polymerase subunit alpha [Chloroflexota bacterium]